MSGRHPWVNDSDDHKIKQWESASSDAVVANHALEILAELCVDSGYENDPDLSAHGNTSKKSHGELERTDRYSGSSDFQ
jgi:hypothetical protein